MRVAALSWPPSVGKSALLCEPRTRAQRTEENLQLKWKGKTEAPPWIHWHRQATPVPWKGEERYWQIAKWKGLLSREHLTTKFCPSPLLYTYLSCSLVILTIRKQKSRGVLITNPHWDRLADLPVTRQGEGTWNKTKMSRNLLEAFP